MSYSLASPTLTLHGSRSGGQSLQIDQIQDRRVYRLPHRDLSSASRHGWAAITCGLFGATLGLCWMANTAFPELWNNNAPNLGMVALGCFGLVFILPAIAIAYCGVAVLRNKTYCTIELGQDGLVSRDRVGWFFSWSRQHPLATITQLKVAQNTQRSGNAILGDSGLTLADWLSNWKFSLVAETDEGYEFVVAAGYDRELLLSLATDLAPRLNSQSTWIAPRIKRPGLKPTGREQIGAIEVVDDQQPNPGQADLAMPKPKDSATTIERRDHGITVRVPAVGFKHNMIFLAFASVWNGFVLLAAYLFAGDNLLNAVILIPHSLIGVGLALTVAHLSLRKTILASEHDRLLIKIVSPIRTKKREWWSDQIHEIKVGTANFDTATPTMELQVRSVGEGLFRCLWQLPTDELEWIASELRRSLQLAPGANVLLGEPDTSGRLMPLATSRLLVQDIRDATGAESVSINLPPRGIRRYLPGVVAGITCLFASILVIVFTSVVGNVDPFLVEFLYGWAFILATIGIAFLFHFLSMAKTSFWIHADHAQLTIRQDGILRTSHYAYAQQELDPLQISQPEGKDQGSEIIVRPGDPDSAKLAQVFEYDDLVFVAESINRTMNLK